MLRLIILLTLMRIHLEVLLTEGQFTVPAFEGQKVDVPARSVRKRFKVGDHVKVMSGQNQDETGLVVSVVGNVVTFLSDMSMQEVCLILPLPIIC